MATQEFIALAIVGMTAALFVRAAVRRRRLLPWQRAGGCGCGASKATPPGLRLSGRKGEKPSLCQVPAPVAARKPGST